MADVLELADVAPAVSDAVQIGAADEQGFRVIKLRSKDKYLQFGPQESFLLEQCDGALTCAAICGAFEQRFREPLSCAELNEFIALVRKEGLLAGVDDREPETTAAGLQGFIERAVAAARKQNAFYFRVKLIDPNSLLDWLEPRTRWLFSRRLAILAAIGFVAALMLTWMNRVELVAQLASLFDWRTLLLAWLTTVVVTVCHEFGHGLACKRYGGEVREMGALWIFFTPCLYCNVSDAWLTPSKTKRLIVSLAGTYVDLLIWIVAVGVWRVTTPDTAVNFMAWIVVTTCGLRVAFNLNPLMRLDGYYALSDYLGIPNLRKRSRARWMEYVRWLLWGAERPKAIKDGRTLLIYGAATWFFTVALLNLLFFKVTAFLKAALGIAGFLSGAGLFIAMSKRYFKGSLGKDFAAMFSQRKRRVFVWALLGLGLLAIPFHDQAGGAFHVRPAVRWEVRSPIDGFLREVAVDEGDFVKAGDVIARIEIPGLASDLRSKRAEILEVEALLRKLKAGPRPELLEQTQAKVERAEAWRDLAIRDLERARNGYQETMAGLELRIAKANSDLEFREAMYKQSLDLNQRGGLAGQQLLAEKRGLEIARAELFQAQAAKRAREAEGLMHYESELARREKDLADTRAALSLLQAGTRPEEIEAQEAKLARLQVELKHLLHREAAQRIVAPAAGTVTTPRLKERMGRFLTKGAELCFVEDQDKLEAEIAVPEENARVLRPGQAVTLKPRCLPFHRLQATVDRIAPSAMGKTDAAGQQLTAQRTVTVYCRLDNDSGQLRSGMTGFGRVYHRWRPLGLIGLTRALQFIRTEFWI